MREEKENLILLSIITTTTFKILNCFIYVFQSSYSVIEGSPTLINIEKIKAITQKMEFDVMVKVLR